MKGVNEITNTFMMEFENAMKASKSSDEAAEILHTYNQAALHIFCGVTINFAANSKLGLDNIGQLLKKQQDYVVETVADMVEDIKDQKPNCHITKIKVPKGKGEQQ